MKPEKFIVVKLGEGYEVNANKKRSKSCGKKKANLFITYFTEIDNDGGGHKFERKKEKFIVMKSQDNNYNNAHEIPAYPYLNNKFKINKNESKYIIKLF